MAEEEGPGRADPLMEIDRTVGGIGLKFGAVSPIRMVMKISLVWLGSCDSALGRLGSEFESGLMLAEKDLAAEVMQKIAAAQPVHHRSLDLAQVELTPIRAAAR
jgi:hypothetical protein